MFNEEANQMAYRHTIRRDEPLSRNTKCAHCGRGINRYNNREIKIPKYGVFKSTTIYHICPECYKLFSLAKSLIQPEEFPTWMAKFTSTIESTRDEAVEELDRSFNLTIRKADTLEEVVG